MAMAGVQAGPAPGHTSKLRQRDKQSLGTTPGSQHGAGGPAREGEASAEGHRVTESACVHQHASVRVCVSVCLRAHVLSTCVCLYLCACACVCVCVPRSPHVRLCVTCMHAPAHAHACLCPCLHVCMCPWVSLCTCACARVCACLHVLHTRVPCVRPWKQLEEQ